VNTPPVEAADLKHASPPSPPPPPPTSELSSQSPAPHGFTCLIPPPPLVGFVARRDPQGRYIVERLKEELAPGRKQRVTLSGAGGLGKTTLAAEAARDLLMVYESRVVWSSADGLADFTLSTLLDDIAAQFGRADLRPFPPAVKEAQVRALVAEPVALVVLDNYETIAAAEQRRIEAWFATTQCSALFTSRPKIPGTVFVPVSAMSREEAEEFLEKLTEQTQDPQIFSAEIRGRVYDTAEANPYVMQWVVAQIDNAQEPDTVLMELAQGDADTVERVFDRSYNLLDGDGRDALLALSLFAPSATRDALAEVAGFDDAGRVKEAVKNLNRLWLVKAVDVHHRLAVEGLTRTLAASRLSKDQRADEFRRRFVAYFLRYAVEHENPTPEDYDTLEEEKDNLLRAAEEAFASGDWRSVMTMAYALGKPVSGMLSVRGYWDEAVRLGEQALQAARSSQDEAQIANLSHNVAVMYGDRGELAEARRLYDESLEIEKRLGNRRGVASTLHQLATLAQDQGEMEEACRLYDESLEINERLGDQRGIALTVWGLGNISLNQGYFDKSKKLFHEALETFRNLEDQANTAGLLHQLGRVAQAQGEMEEARRLYDESLEINERLGDQSGVAISLHQLAMLAEDKGDKAEARRLYNESLEIEKRLGNQRGVASTLHNLAALAQGQGEMDEARRLYDESLEIKKRLGNQSGVASTLHQLGRLAEDKGDKAEARRLYDESLEIAKRLGNQSVVASTLHQLAMLAEDEGDKAEAAQLFREALSIFERLGSPDAEIARESLARVEDGSS
jgi:tetratricopeptide (TPR) repeat protein